MESSLGSNPIDAGKLTIASYSANLIQRQLVRGKRVAMFSPTHAALYGAVRASCIGGLTYVGRSTCDADSPPINQHWADRLREEGGPPICRPPLGPPSRPGRQWQPPPDQLRREKEEADEAAAAAAAAGGCDPPLPEDFEPRQGRKLFYFDVSSLYASAAGSERACAAREREPRERDLPLLPTSLFLFLPATPIFPARLISFFLIFFCTPTQTKRPGQKEPKRKNEGGTKQKNARKPPPQQVPVRARRAAGAGRGCSV